MAIPPQRMKIDLTKENPTQITPESMKKQLNNIGLLCDDVTVPVLQVHIDQVRKNLQDALPLHGTQSFAIMTTKDSATAVAAAAVTPMVTALGTENLVKSSDADWTTSATALGYLRDLEYIQFPTHFDLLMQDAANSGFTGHREDPPPTTGYYASIDAIKLLFTSVGVNVASQLVKGIDTTSIESAFSNAIAPLNDAQAVDYHPPPDSRVFFLVENYNAATGEADGIGFVAVKWQLTIKDYKQKKPPLTQHDTHLTMNMWSALYSKTEDLQKDITYVKGHLKTNVFKIEPKKTTITVFPTLPPANQATALASLPTMQKVDYIDFIVLYSPDLHEVGSLDNTESAAEATYSKTVTSGFTFETSQSFTVGLSMQANFEVAKVGATFEFTLSFTEQWSKSESETIQFSVPGGEKAFTYQGTLRAATLRYTPNNDTYKYTDYARFLTNVLVTRKTPLVSPA